ncbi:MAG: PLP-dependent aminotransferase family protein [Acidobacteria bacterium]|nr:PLP-dependent aminotransferase family protein [Acidobacteriota bacterium]
MNPSALDILLDRSAREPLYLQFVAGIAAGIRKGRLRPGDCLPGSRALAEHFRVNRNTVIAAFRELEAEGWIRCEPDRGSFVAEHPPQLVPSEEASIAAGDSGSWTSATPLTEPFFQPRAVDRGGFRLIPELPDVRLAPTAAIHRAHGRVLNLQQQRILQPAWDPRGLLDLRVSLCRLLRELRGLVVEPGNLVLTRGLMSTLNLVSRVLFAPGDAVAVENPGYFRVAEAFQAAGARLFPIPVDGEGLRVDLLQELMAREPVKLVCITASPQHPTHAVLSTARRSALLGLVQASGARILEGDPSLGFQRESNPSLPLASQDSRGSVLYYSALEPMLAPGMQVGFIVGAAGLAKTLAKQRQLIDWPGNPVQEATIEELFRDGEIHRHLSRIRKITDARRESMVDRILLHLHPHLQVEDPKEGLSLWVRVSPQVNLDAFTERCAAKGVVFYPGRLYEFSRRPLPAICLGFAAHDLAEQNEACRRMAEALAEVIGGAARASG